MKVSVSQSVHVYESFCQSVHVPIFFSMANLLKDR